MATLLRSSFQNRLNLVRSAARWLGSRAATVWAKQYKCSELMAEYATSLQELATIMTQPEDVSRLVELIEHHPALTIEGELSALLASIKTSLAPISLTDVFAAQNLSTPPELPFLIFFSPELENWTLEVRSTGETRLALSTEIALWQAMQYYKKG